MNRTNNNGGNTNLKYMGGSSKSEFGYSYHYARLIGSNYKVSCQKPEATHEIFFSDRIFVLLSEQESYIRKGWYNYGYFVANGDDYKAAQKPESTRGSKLPIATHVCLLSGTISVVPLLPDGTLDGNKVVKIEYGNLYEIPVLFGLKNQVRQHINKGVARSTNGGVRNTTKVTIATVSHDEILRLRTKLETLVGLAVSGVVVYEIEKQIDSTSQELRNKGDSEFVNKLFASLKVDNSESGVGSDTTPPADFNFSEVERSISEKFDKEAERLDKASAEISLKNEREVEMVAIRAAIEADRLEAETEASEVTPTKRSKKTKNKELVTVS